MDEITTEGRRRRPDLLDRLIGYWGLATGVIVVIRSWLAAPKVWLEPGDDHIFWKVTGGLIAAGIVLVAFYVGQLWGRSGPAALVLAFLWTCLTFTDGVVTGIMRILFGGIVLWGHEDDPPARLAKKAWARLKPKPASIPATVGAG